MEVEKQAGAGGLHHSIARPMEYCKHLATGCFSSSTFQCCCVLTVASSHKLYSFWQGRGVSRSISAGFHYAGSGSQLVLSWSSFLSQELCYSEGVKGGDFFAFLLYLHFQGGCQTGGYTSRFSSNSNSGSWQGRGVSGRYLLASTPQVVEVSWYCPVRLFLFKSCADELNGKYHEIRLDGSRLEVELEL